MEQYGVNVLLELKPSSVKIYIIAVISNTVKNSVNEWIFNDTLVY